MFDTKIAVIADIHANMTALEAVLAHIEAQNIKRIWCLGDMIGRGFEPHKVAPRLRRLYQEQSPIDQQAWLIGNHEMLLFNKIPAIFISDDAALSGDNYNAVYMANINRELLANRERDKKWLLSLPTHNRPYPGRGVYLAHATYQIEPETGDVNYDLSYRSYLLEPVHFRKQFQNLMTYAPADDPPFLMMSGHTHIASLWQWQTAHNDVMELPFTPGTPSPVFQRGRDVIFVNPGSVGFPRKRDTCPMYVILETGSGDDAFAQVQITFQRVPYDTSAIEEPTHFDYPPAYWREMHQCDET